MSGWCMCKAHAKALSIAPKPEAPGGKNTGSVRLAWSYPPDDQLLTPSLITPGDADTVYSRTVKVKVG